MGFLSSLFGGGSSSSSVSTVQNTTTVSVNPEIVSVNVLDLSPVEKLISNLAGVQVTTAQVQAEAGLLSAAATAAATDRQTVQTAENFKTIALAGVALAAVMIFRK